MISQTIAGYLKNNRRLVVPALGAFIRKDADGAILFVEIFQQDDGVLKGLLAEHYALSTEEATQAIEAFNANVKRRAPQPEGFIVEGIGRLRINANGVCELSYDSTATASSAAPRPQTAEPVRATVATPRVTAPEKRATEPARIERKPQDDGFALKGMRYQKPAPKHPDKRKKTADIIMIIAIGAASIAIASMIFGASNKNPKVTLPQATEQVDSAAL